MVWTTLGSRTAKEQEQHNKSCIVNTQIGVGDSKYVIVFDPLLTSHVIRRMHSSRVRIFNGNQWETLPLITQERIGVGASNLDRRRVFVLGGKVGHVTRHVRQLYKIKRSKVKVTRSRARNLRSQGLLHW